MKIKRFLSLLLAAVLVLCFCSCGKMTAERLVAEVIKAVSATNSFSGTMNTGLEMKLAVSNQSIDMSVTMDADVSCCDKTSYTGGTVTAAVNGREVRANTEIYTVAEGDSVTTYTLTNGEWTKLELEKPEITTSLGAVLILTKPENLGSVVLQDELDTYNGREVYVLKIADCNYPEFAISTMQSQLGTTFGNIDWSELDLSGVSMQVILKVYKDTKLPAVLIVDFGNSMTTVMESVTEVLFENMMGGMSELEKALLGKIEIKLEIPAAITTVTFDEYDVGTVEVPQEALSAKDMTSVGKGIFSVLFGD